MELDILFLNVLKYKDKETGEDKFRVGYLLNNSDAIQNTQSFHGGNELCFYTNNSVVFEKLTGDYFLKPMIIKVEQKASARNPLRTVSQITEIKTKNDIISLL